MRPSFLAFGLLLASVPSFALPKYGPNAVPLSKRTNLDYFKNNAAADFWALMPYYTAQQRGQQCSAASITMLLNGARAGQSLGSDDQLVTIDSLLEKYSDDRYKKVMSATKYIPGEFDHTDVGNTRLAAVLREAAQKLGIATPATKIDEVRVDLKNLEASRKAFHDALVANEKSADDFILISFVQGRLTGDPEGGPHVAVIGAYDQERKLVLLLDPDREWYEPYWSPEEKVFEAIADPKSDATNPGWVHFQVR